jgi:hypothetical protein
MFPRNNGQNQRSQHCRDYDHRLPKSTHDNEVDLASRKMKSSSVPLGCSKCRCGNPTSLRTLGDQNLISTLLKHCNEMRSIRWQYDLNN